MLMYGNLIIKELPKIGKVQADFKDVKWTNVLDLSQHRESIITYLHPLAYKKRKTEKQCLLS